MIPVIRTTINRTLAENHNNMVGQPWETHQVRLFIRNL